MELTQASATRLWGELATRLEEFLEAWSDGDAPPSLAEHVPAAPPELRRITLEELIKVDLEQRMRARVPRTLDDYVREFPELLAEGAPPVELIYEDCHLRRQQGEKIDFRELLARYPQHAPQLEKLLKLGRSTQEMAIRDGRKHEQAAAGEKLDDFELLALVGRGAFASVFLARQTSMQRLVALKISAVRGFEHQALAQLDHPHIVRVYDQRTLEERGLRLLYMQFAPGGTLQEVVELAAAQRPSQRSGALVIQAIDEALQRVGQLTPEESSTRKRLKNASWSETVCRLGVPLAQALDYAHREGILHRDVKPANVLLTADGAPKLADFNISYASPVSGATAAAYFGGSLAYMSPEQLEASHARQTRRPEELDARSDLYSLAVLLWELLHGERPFRDDVSGSWNQMIDQLLAQRVPPTVHIPLDSPNDLLAQRLRKVLQRTLAAEPAQRPASGAQFARELYLCTQPQAWDLLFAPRNGWLEALRRHPYIAYALAIMPPNMLAAFFNYWYNRQAIIEPLGDHAFTVFWYVIALINGLAFPVGLAVLVGVLWRLARTLRRLDDAPGPDEAALAQARRRALQMGHLAAGVGIMEWFASGVFFPMAMHMGLGEFPASGYWHFFFSMSVCGAVAAAFPFFGATDLSLRVMYPALLGKSPVDDVERRQVEGLARHSVWYLGAACGVPLLGLLMLVGAGSDNRGAILVLIVAGLAGLALAFFASGRIRQSALTLAAATRPADLANFDTQSLEF
ncbi:MAG: serine/threonine-protein kinase [Pirellulales bacterium]